MESSLAVHTVSSNTSEVQVLLPEDNDIEKLEDGETARIFIDKKIKERDLTGGEDPFIVADLDNIFEKFRSWRTHLPRVKPFYAVKCNGTPAVIRTLTTLGAGFDCASKGEIEMATSLGVTPDNIIYAHTTKPRSHIKYACAHGVDLMTFDNEEELVKISQCNPKARLVLRIMVDDSKSLVRLSSKFGARRATFDKLLELARELSLDLMGVSFHVGSGCTDSLMFREAIGGARHVFDKASSIGFNMRLLDIGGGFPGRDDIQVKFTEFAVVINKALDEFFPYDCGVQIIAEPGRYFVASAFTLAINVIAKTENADMAERNNDVKNRMMNYYVNDGVYGSLCCINDPAQTVFLPYPHKEVADSEQQYCSILWGPTCDSLDKIAENLWLPQLDVGDWLLIDNMGAYSISMGTEFNGFGKPHIYSVITNKTWHAVRKSHVTV